MAALVNTNRATARRLYPWLAALALTTAAQAVGATVVSFDEAVAEALNANPDAVIANARTQAAQAGVALARGAARPHLSAEVGAAHRAIRSRTQCSRPARCGYARSCLLRSRSSSVPR